MIWVFISEKVNIKLDENDKKKLTEIMEGNIKDKLLNGTLDYISLLQFVEQFLNPLQIF